MSKDNAIRILEEFLKFKQNCVEGFDSMKFKTDVEDIRASLVNLSAGDKKILEAILSQLKSDKKDAKKEKPPKEGLLSLEVKREIARQIKLGIANYKKNSEKVRVRDSKRKTKSL